MSQQELIREFLALPAHQQQAVEALIVSFQQRNQPVPAKLDKPIDFAREPFIGMWTDRQDLADSSEWVRNLRRTEW